MRCVKAIAIHCRVVLAIALPAVLLASFKTPLFLAFCETAWQHGLTRFLIVGFFVALLAAEAMYFVTLMRFVRAHGKVDRFNAMAVDPKELARRRRWKFRWAAATLATLSGGLIAETGFRLFDIQPPTAPIDCEANLPDVDESVNALGIRETWDELSSDDERIRVAFLGDSFTFGVSVEPENTLPRQVSRMLTETMPDRVLTINLGEIAAAPARELEVYEALREAVEPDVVVQIVNVNDFGAHLYQILEDLYHVRDDRLIVGDTSLLLGYIEKQIRYWMVWNTTLGYYRGGFSPEERADSWLRFERDMRACQERIEANGDTYAIVLFPWLYNLDHYQLRDMHRRMRDMATSMKVPYLDLLEVFVNRDGEALRVCPMDTHPNAEGYRIAAERIAQFLRDDVLPLHADRIDPRSSTKERAGS